jgi:uncharacterized alkaline shock family protein YloU
MSRSRNVILIGTELGTIQIDDSALTGLIVTAVEQVEGARARRPRRGVDISVSDRGAEVEVEVAARYGSVLPELARAVQASVAGALRTSTGLEVSRVDVAVEELDQ